MRYTLIRRMERISEVARHLSGIERRIQSRLGKEK